MKNKKLFIALVALVAIVAIVLGVYFATRPATSEGGKAVTVTVVHKDGSEKVFTYHTDEEYLGTVLVDEGLVEGEQSDYGLSSWSIPLPTAKIFPGPLGPGNFWKIAGNITPKLLPATIKPSSRGRFFASAYESRRAKRASPLLCHYAVPFVPNRSEYFLLFPVTMLPRDQPGFPERR